MAKTRSGDYRLPSSLERWAGNIIINRSKWAPRSVRRRYLRRPTAYQDFGAGGQGSGQGKSINKWHALQLPADLRGSSVLDIGCADGFFCQMCAKSGADRVVGMDGALGRLLWARLAALDAGLNIEFRLDLFPDAQTRDKFDWVLCLSVLHHLLVNKDLWKVLQEPGANGDLDVLRGGLEALRSRVKPGGSCVIEMPYEYEDPAERDEVDFDLFNEELARAGFNRPRCLGGWEHEAANQQKKDRIIYAAEA